MRSPGSRSKLVVTLIGIVAAISAVIVITDESGPPDNPHRRTITVTLGGPGRAKLVLPPAAQKITAQQAHEDAVGNDTAAESDLHENAPPAPGAAAQADKLKPPGQPAVPDRVPLAAASEPGCTTALVRNYSSRRGAPVLLGVIHWTGSSPTPGSPAGGSAVVRWFDTPASQASSSEVTDQDGRCWLTVPESQKAWTQAGFNPWAVSVEIVNAGVQPLFQTAKARATVVRLMRGWHKRWGLPYRYAKVSGCTVVRSGFLAHRDLGSCGGGHPDVGTFDLAGLIREAAGPTVTHTDRVTCRRLNWWRQHGRRGGKARRNAVRRRRALDARHVTCTARGPVRQ